MLHSVNFCPSAILTDCDSYAMLAKVTTLRDIKIYIQSEHNTYRFHTDWLNDIINTFIFKITFFN